MTPRPAPTTDPLVARGFGAIVTPAIPPAAIDEVAPVIRQAVEDQLLLLAAETRAAKDSGRHYPFHEIIRMLDGEGE